MLPQPLSRFLNENLKLGKTMLSVYRNTVIMTITVAIWTDINFWASQPPMILIFFSGSIPAIQQCSVRNIGHIAIDLGYLATYNNLWAKFHKFLTFNSFVVLLNQVKVLSMKCPVHFYDWSRFSKNLKMHSVLWNFSKLEMHVTLLSPTIIWLYYAIKIYFSHLTIVQGPPGTTGSGFCEVMIHLLRVQH